MTTTSATRRQPPPPAAEQTPIAQAIGEIHDRRVSVLSEYKKNSGLFSFGGPRDSFRREALSVQVVAQTVLERREALAFAGAIAGGVAVIPASIGTALAVGVSLGLAGTLAAIFALSLGAVLLIPAGFVAGIGIGECVGRIAKKVLAKKEERNIAKLAEIKDEASLTRHWKELKQGDRFFLLDKMAWEEKGFEGEYEKLQSAKVLSKEDTRYFKAATFSKGYKGERKLAEEDPEYEKFDYFVSQAISLNFLEKKHTKSSSQFRRYTLTLPASTLLCVTPRLLIQLKQLEKGSRNSPQLQSPTSTSYHQKKGRNYSHSSSLHSRKTKN